MTSPNQPEPDPTNDNYDDVHSVGSAFGQDLTEDSVRTMLMSRGKSPFQRALENFAGAIGGLISGIANAITGNGGAQFTEISAAVETRLGPINTMISESADRHEALADQVESNSTEQATINQSIQDEHQRRWNELQGETNHLVQEQLWQHQDMIELLDIRAPKTWGALVSSATESRACPFSTDTDAVPYWSTPYIEVWSFSGSTYVACRGDWVGSYEVTVNWDNGAVDNFVHRIDIGSTRVGRFTGGAAHISKRHISVTVNPRSLRRRLFLTAHMTGWSTIEGDLARYISPDGFKVRLRNAAVCLSPVVVMGEEGVLETIPPGDTIPATEIDVRDQPTHGINYLFYEQDDPAVDYSFRDGRPPGGSDYRVTF